MLMGM
ncbi:hypothetical protein VCHC37A1_1511A, partial [Vibrio cholerae HC-37A1]